VIGERGLRRWGGGAMDAMDTMDTIGIMHMVG